MTTVQIIGIAVASLAVLLLIIALIVTRRRGDAPDSRRRRRPASSFLDDAPQDTFSGLGKAEQPVEDVTIDPAVERGASRASAPAAAAPRLQRPSARPQPGGLGLDWGPDLQRTDDRPGRRAGTCAPLRRRDGDHGRAAAGRGGGAPRAETRPRPPTGESGDQVGRHAAARPAEGEAAAADVAAPESGSGGRLVPLSDIIVTTSGKMVDLRRPRGAAHAHRARHVRDRPGVASSASRARPSTPCCSSPRPRRSRGRSA